MTLHLSSPPKFKFFQPASFLPAEAQTITTAWAERVEKLLAQEVVFISHESFRTANSQLAASDRKQIAAAIQASRSAAAVAKQSPGLHATYQRMCETPLLSPEMEVVCFRHYNYLKFQANALRATLNPNKVERSKVVTIERLLEEAAENRNFIVQANCRLAMSIVKKYADSPTVFDEYLSEAISNLMGAVEKFDFSRGFRFSTYATRSIQRRIFRILAQRHRQRARFVNNSDEVLTATLGAAEVRSAKDGQDSLNQLQSMLMRLEQRERLILEARFGLQTFGQKQTYLEIATTLKLSKERVRQLADRAILKLRMMAEELNFELN